MGWKCQFVLRNHQIRGPKFFLLVGHYGIGKEQCSSLSASGASSHYAPHTGFIYIVRRVQTQTQYPPRSPIIWGTSKPLLSGLRKKLPRVGVFDRWPDQMDSDSRALHLYACAGGRRQWRQYICCKRDTRGNLNFIIDEEPKPPATLEWLSGCTHCKSSK